MKKLQPSLAATLVACLALASFAIAAERATTKIGSTVSAKYKAADPNDPYGKSEFKGVVGPKKCAEGRRVSVESYGKEKTDSKGRFSLTIDGPADPGRYKVKVAPKTISKGGNDVVCSGAKAVIKVGKGG